MLDYWNYYGRSIITDRTIRNNRPDIIILDSTIKEAYLRDAAILKSQPSHHHHREAPEVNKFGRRACKNMANEIGPYNASSTVHKVK